MIRLFIAKTFTPDTRLELPVPQAHYLQHVMRLRENDKIEVFNGTQGAWIATFHPTAKKAALTLIKQHKKQPPQPFLGLAFACLKRENTELVIQKATELGVSDIFPLITHHTVCRKINTDRLKTIATEASEQSERLSVPTLHPILSLSDFIAKAKDFNLYFLAERTTPKPVAISDKPCFVIGPEGGFSADEKKLFDPAHSICLGDQILRAETAAISILSTYQFKRFLK